MDVVKEIASKYGSMSLIEFDGYFEGKFEPEKYTSLEVQTEIMEVKQIIEYANKIRIKLKQNSIGLEVDKKLTLGVKLNFLPYYLFVTSTSPPLRTSYLSIVLTRIFSSIV